MRGYFERDFFGGHFGPGFGGMGGPPFGCPFRDFPGGNGPFGPRFDHSPERHGPHHHAPHHHGPDHHGPHHHGPYHHGPDHHRRGPAEDGHRGPRCGGSESDSEGPAERHCHGPPGFRRRGGRHHDFHGHGPSCHHPGPRPWFDHSPERHCPRRGPSEFPERPWRGPWKGPWGADRHMHGFGLHGPSHPCGGHRRPGPYHFEERPSGKNCEKCRETEPCCSGNKENRGCGRQRKENGPCGDKDKDQNVGDTVFVQRIVLEKATRPQSV